MIFSQMRQPPCPIPKSSTHSKSVGFCVDTRSMLPPAKEDISCSLRCFNKQLFFIYITLKCYCGGISLFAPLCFFDGWYFSRTTTSSSCCCAAVEKNSDGVMVYPFELREIVWILFYHQHVRSMLLCHRTKGMDKHEVFVEVESKQACNICTQNIYF